MKREKMAVARTLGMHSCAYVYVYIYIYIMYLTIPDQTACRTIGWRYLSNADSFVFYGITCLVGYLSLLHDSPLLKSTCVRQVVLDKWFPLTPGPFSPKPRRSRTRMCSGSRSYDQSANSESANKET